MKKPMISLVLLMVALQACSGKPAGFQGETTSVSGTSDSGQATGRTFGNRDAESGDATAMPGDADAIARQTVETDSIDIETSVVYDGVEATISVPADAETTASGNTSSNSPTSGSNTTTGDTSTPTTGDTTTDASTPTTGDTTTGDTTTSEGSDAGSSTTPSAPSAPEPLTLTITVPSTSLRAGSAPMQATAKISGQNTAAHVTWSVKSSDGQYAGSIDENGLYTAPATGGGYDIILSAMLYDDPSVTASVTIRIIAAEQIFVGCQQGSEFFPITADVYQLPTDTRKLPDFSTIGSKLTTVCMDQYNVAPRDWSTGFPGVTGLYEWFALRTSTRIMVDTDGTYSFKLNSDDGAKLYIDGQLVIDNDGQHAPTAKESSLMLTAGEHALSIDYFQGPRYQIALELYWKIPGASSYVYVPKASFK